MTTEKPRNKHDMFMKRNLSGENHETQVEVDIAEDCSVMVSLRENFTSAPFFQKSFPNSIAAQEFFNGVSNIIITAEAMNVRGNEL